LHGVRHVSHRAKEKVRFWAEKVRVWAIAVYRPTPLQSESVGGLRPDHRVWLSLPEYGMCRIFGEKMGYANADNDVATLTLLAPSCENARAHAKTSCFCIVARINCYLSFCSDSSIINAA